MTTSLIAARKPTYIQTPRKNLITIYGNFKADKGKIARIFDSAMELIKFTHEFLVSFGYSPAYHRIFNREDLAHVTETFAILSQLTQFNVAFLDFQPLFHGMMGIGSPSALFPRSGLIILSQKWWDPKLEIYQESVFATQLVSFFAQTIGKEYVWVSKGYHGLWVDDMKSAWLLKDIFGGKTPHYRITNNPTSSSFSYAVFATLISEQSLQERASLTFAAPLVCQKMENFFTNFDAAYVSETCQNVGLDITEENARSINLFQYWKDTRFIRTLLPEAVNDWALRFGKMNPCWIRSYTSKWSEIIIKVDKIIEESKNLAEKIKELDGIWEEIYIRKTPMFVDHFDNMPYQLGIRKIDPFEDVKWVPLPLLHTATKQLYLDKEDKQSYKVQSITISYSQKLGNEVTINAFLQGQNMAIFTQVVQELLCLFVNDQLESIFRVPVNEFKDTSTFFLNVVQIKVGLARVIKNRNILMALDGYEGGDFIEPGDNFFHPYSQTITIGERNAAKFEVEEWAFAEALLLFKTIAEYPYYDNSHRDPQMAGLGEIRYSIQRFLKPVYEIRSLPILSNLKKPDYDLYEDGFSYNVKGKEEALSAFITDVHPLVIKKVDDLITPADFDSASEDDKREYYNAFMFLRLELTSDHLKDLILHSSLSQCLLLARSWDKYKLIYATLVELGIPLRVLSVDEAARDSIVQAARISKDIVLPNFGKPCPQVDLFGFKSMISIMKKAVNDALCVIFAPKGRKCKYPQSDFPFLHGENFDTDLKNILIVKNTKSVLASRFYQSKIYPSSRIITLNYSWRWRWSRYKNAKYMACAIAATAFGWAKDGTDLSLEICKI